MEPTNFENLPKAVAELIKGQSELKALLLKTETFKDQIETPLNIKEVSKLTELSVPTLYGYAQRNQIPYYKKGNRLRFFYSEIISWIKEDKVKTIEEINASTDSNLDNRKKRR